MNYRRHLVLVAALAVQGDAVAAVRTSIQLTVKGELTSTSGLASSSAPSIVQRSLALTNGVGLNQADTVWSDRRQLAASTAEDLDVDGGGLTDAFGTAFAPVKIKVLVVYADSGNTNDVVVGGDANSVPLLSTAATTVSVQPGGILMLSTPALAGYAVTASTGDIIQIENGGAGSVVDYDILINGTSS